MSRQFLIGLFLFPFFFSAFGQSHNVSVADGSDSLYYQGYWSGDVRFRSYHLPLAFDVTGSNVLFENPVQISQKIPFDSVHYGDTSLLAYIDQVTFVIDRLNSDKARAILCEGDDRTPFILFRNKEISPPDRPQHPLPGNDYNEEGFTFVNKSEGIKLSGTLTLPHDRPSSLIVLLTGSGPQDRDETIMKHKPFAVLADFLCRQGVGVLRYDDRGVAESEGSHTTATSYHFAEDAAAALTSLKDRYPEAKVGFLGHSEGGIIAQIADSLVGGADFHIYLAGPGIDIVTLMAEQNRQVLSGSIDSLALEAYVSGLRPLFQEVFSLGDLPEKQSRLTSMAKELYNSLPIDDAKKIAPSDMAYAISIGQLLYLKWWPYFLGYRPERYLKHITCPILALNGSEDIQVTPDNLDAIAKYATHADVTTIQMEGHNHLFQECSSCNLREYGMLTQTISPATLNEIKSWMKEYSLID